MKSIYSERMGLQYNAYPFKFTDHIVYALEKLANIHEDWGYEMEPVYFQPFGDGFAPTRSRDYNLAQLFQYLEFKGFISILYCNNKEYYRWFKTPIVDMPRMKVHVMWKIKIHKQDDLLAFSRLVKVRTERFNELDLRCHLTVLDSRLYLIVENEKCELKKFNDSSSKDIFKRLVIQGIVERDSEGYVKGKGTGGGIKVGSLVDVVRNSGFKKKARNILFYKCSEDFIELKMKLLLDGEEINYILDTFVRHNDQKIRLSKSKNRDIDSFISSDNPFKP